MADVLIVGHSHLTALQRACNATPADAKGSVRYRFIQLRDPNFQPHLENGTMQANLLAEVNAKSFDVAVSMIGGNYHSVFGLLNHPVRYDFVLPQMPDLYLAEDVDVLPFNVVRDQLQEQMQYQHDVMGALRQVVKGPVYHIESPPPVPSEQHIRRYPGVFASKIDTLGVSPATFRYKLWKLNSELTRKFCMTNEIDFIPAPAAMRDKNDMLVAEAWNPDPTHGNALYGEHVRRAIEAKLSLPR